MWVIIDNDISNIEESIGSSDLTGILYLATGWMSTSVTIPDGYTTINATTDGNSGNSYVLAVRNDLLYTE